MTHKVSIIVPIYNQEAYLHRCLDSLVNQTYTNLDIVLIDDGSTDSSFNICSEYMANDDRIQLIKQENSGVFGAKITGIKHTLGDYIAFVDPDDYVTNDFIENFLVNNKANYDMIAMGFYIEESTGIKPYTLAQTREYENDEIFYLRQNFLMTNGQLSNDIFVARWNKLYKAEKVKDLLKQLEKCRDISLGDDTLFNYLFLTVATKVKVQKTANGYIYNRNNLNSMTLKEDISKWINKTKLAYQVFQDILKDGEDSYLPEELYYILIESLFNRMKDLDGKEFSELYVFLRRDDIYQQSLKKISGKLSHKQKIQLCLRKNCPTSAAYIRSIELFKDFSFALRLVKFDIKNTINTFKIYSPIRSYYQTLFNRRRFTAYRDLKRDLPLLEKRIAPLLTKYENQKTDFDAAPIVKNIFVMWWDGFEVAPEIVKSCLRSVKRFYGDYRIIEIDKYNYHKFTDIDDRLTKAFSDGKLSIQIFSDILRFNLLKNNGGIWLDATIFFTDYYPFVEQLENQSFSSIEFSESKQFLTYNNLPCSWSGFSIASRKNGLLVSAMDNIFKEYYAKYNNFQNYFFIDSAMMVCKLLKIDNDVLSSTQYHPETMFSLINLLNQPYNKVYDRQMKALPQKLIWSIDTELMSDDSCYSVYVKKGGI